MRLTIIGCSGSFPGPDGPASCYLVEAAGFRLLLDLGNGALGALQRHIGLYDVDAVYLSHLHADHCLDLCSYWVARTYAPDGAKPRIPVYGPVGTADRMARAYDLDLDPGMRTAFEFRELRPGRFDLGPFRTEVDLVNHPVEAYGIRLEHGGGAIAYSGDTGPSANLVRLARGADVLLCEASFLDGPGNPPDMHLTGREAAEHARAADARRLVLTHLVPWVDSKRVYDEAVAAFDGPVELARSGASYEAPESAAAAT
ncbi:MBL fold metallo-hydrolase [Allonocardiopsis opalescens]|uniref:Ribonuclease BN (tRNA processing enzyme) n=1 Tax=Allonocardiopsis opalescens TaxID=1144618 RepID=A0A2T0Q946_9ACTN|nr:MBL fold metallo-hydrolase [Allonocardiopsis opalescens]PRY00375.1 ribonuclease BN (tRNA processing enzyme) [Allonocardiopsis opalescens]